MNRGHRDAPDFVRSTISGALVETRSDAHFASMKQGLPGYVWLTSVLHATSVVTALRYAQPSRNVARRLCNGVTVARHQCIPRASMYVAHISGVAGHRHRGDYLANQPAKADLRTLAATIKAR